MANYYYLSTVLPPLNFETAPSIGFEEFQTLLENNLTSDDAVKVSALRRLYDIENMRAYWKGTKLKNWGNFNENELKEILSEPEELFEYAKNYLETYTTKESRLQHFSILINEYYKQEQKQPSRFLKEFLKFEQDWRLIFMAYRAKQMERELPNELRFEDSENELLAELLHGTDTGNFVLPEEYQDMTPLLEQYGDAPVELYKALCAYRMKKIDELLGFDGISIEFILGYMAKLFILLTWHELKPK